MSKTALVTGASGGIGEELARLLASRGAHVVLAATSAGKLAALAAELQRSQSLRLAPRAAVRRLVQRLQSTP